MVNVYLFIELLRAANAADVADKLKALELGECKFANVVVLADDKLVAQLDCKTSTGANLVAPISQRKALPSETDIPLAALPDRSRLFINSN